MLLQNKVAVVTGATRGIGRAIAITLANNGASLIINGTNKDRLQKLMLEIEETGQECLMITGDVADPKTAEEVIETAINYFYKMDILVNNAGINMRSSTLEMDLEDWHKVLDINLNGSLYFCKTALPYMIKNRYGKIVNVSSTAAKTAHKNAAPSYGASKAGVDYLTRHLAIEMSEHNINVNGVNPGPVETDMSSQWTDEYRQQVLSKIPLQKLGTPQNVADTVLFLTSEMSDFITGETINVNGGTYMN
ncbi:3-oxoacyl-[acyl-carrier protein] reductase [Salibacterium salarium]|uniref:SDR family NAD(P)-dependent oxidoreductase n=1 Tax=Salibacterium salarium TaxID=284579 RepID=UPI0027824031|nr:SDR family NAD(P)-dependent oxidoreductase [Salibacterium salarium]MDQ0300359.1 3-oxoacyl-[acyl-carrier protein] reductase [Salibacterium salarium]